MVVAGDSGVCDFVADRAGRMAKMVSNGSIGVQIIAHGHDGYALLGGNMLLDFRHGGTLQQKVLYLFFENATNGIFPDTCIEKVLKL